MYPKRTYQVMRYAEMLRKHFQHQLFVSAMGGLLPDVASRVKLNSVLDLPCGSGIWANEFAQAYPQVTVVGVDGDAELMQIAMSCARAANLENAYFQLDDIHTELHFPDGRFDIVRIHSGSGDFTVQEWPAVLQRMRRILRPGGWINLHEFEFGPTSSPALNTLVSLVSKGTTLLGRSLNEHVFTPAVHYSQLLAEAGFVNVAYTLYPLDISRWSHSESFMHMLIHLSMIDPALPYLIKQNLISQAEIDKLMEEVREQIERIDFCALGMLLSVYAMRP